ncbi:hypothetical protein KVR01_009246 [Diaporthe batatas]|uniref:uncharacterized protein n=1 Tax=Diaporthe batatas TaxID=748121 RepID=UPI001D04E299|nr:uncharacterized protein KVR01_009246 [Diaporthe batatas]KAG8160982.1 hypothetical protein KVR01_009246 [Diaporthe batatas]
MSTTATLNRTDGSTHASQSRTGVPQTDDLRPFEITDWDPVPIQSRRKFPNTTSLETQYAKASKSPLTLKTSPNDISRSPNYVTTPERQPHSAYTYSAFPSTSPNFVRDSERRNSTWAVPRRPPAYNPPSTPRDDNARCNVLVVSNLPAETSEDELRGIFASQPGYDRMSLRATASGPSCFVQFDDVTAAARALRNLYGWPLKHSRTGGIRLSFSKDHLGMPPSRPLTPRTWRRAPPPPPLVLPVRPPLHSPGGFASDINRRPVAVPESPTSSIEVQSVSSASVGESATTLVADEKLGEGEPSAEAKTAPPADPQGALEYTPSEGLQMHTVRGPDYKLDMFDNYRLWLEEAVEMELDWYPLPPIKQPLRLSQSRLVWTYNGNPMSIYLSEDETQRCSGYLEDIRGKSPTSKPAIQHESPDITYYQKAKAIVEAWARIQILSWQLSRGSSNVRASNASPANAGDTREQLESHLCLEKYPTPTQDATLLRLKSIEHMEDDFEFFVRARSMMCDAEGSWLRQLLPWSYRDVRFSKVCFEATLTLADGDTLKGVDSGALNAT